MKPKTSEQPVDTNKYRNIRLIAFDSIASGKMFDCLEFAEKPFATMGNDLDLIAFSMLMGWMEREIEVVKLSSNTWN